MLTSRRDEVLFIALFSVAAGFLHAAVIDSHRGHGIAASVFAAIAVFQIVWAGFVLARPTRWLLVAGAVGNAAIVVGWVLSRTTGIGFVDGFEDVESVTRTDAIVTVFEAAIVLGA